MKYLEVIVPVKNEQKNVSELVKRIDHALNAANIEYGITFVDDNSDDKTAEVLKELSKNYPLKVHKKQGKPGKAYSILEAAEKSNAEFLAMIDGDLQYSPEALPDMFKKLSEHALVVARRMDKRSSRLRKLMSRTFNFVFGKMLFGIDLDVQSGLKVFKKELLDYVDKKGISAWTLDLPLIHTALELGYSIGEVEIEFKERKNGESKVKVVSSTLEIASNAIKLKLKKKSVYEIPSEHMYTMRGAGLVYKRKRFITHSKLDHRKSALKTFYPWQVWTGVLLGLIFLTGLLLNLLLTLQLTVAVLSLIYFIDVLFNAVLVFKSLHNPPELTFSDEEISEIDEKKLPVYSVLCPLYREARVVPHFLEAMESLDWPKNKLDVQLLLEEDDKETIEAVKELKLPGFVRVNIVPESQPKTKPKACNFGLSDSRGEYVVIYDAEDIPEPAQLKKAYLAFQKSDKNVICMQAKLNYFNPHQNLLTRFFTSEYSLWFDVMLPGFQSIETNIPLGGTSNHFKKESLLKIQGWDPFNVTEDCDLGVRLFMEGNKTAIIDSTTLEEANSSFKNWLRQRSRWIKGYFQTFFVHMRNPGELIRKQKWHFLLLILVLGARVTFGLINPILWFITISYFSLRPIVGDAIEALYPPYVFYPAVFSLVAGNFTYLYYYMIGSAKREQYSVIKYVLLIPIYWVMWSAASFIAFYQLLVKPHYWEKTIHGLHLGKQEKLEEKFALNALNAIAPEILDKKKESLNEENLKKFSGISISSPVAVLRDNKYNKWLIRFIREKSVLVSGSMLVLAMMVAHVSNFVFNAYLGRNLSLESFGDLTLFTSLLYLSSIPLGSFSSTITHNIAHLFGKYSKQEAKGYLKFITKKSSIYGMVLTLIWVLLIPVMTKFFQSESIFPFLVFTPVWMVGVLSSNFSGYLKGTLSFGTIAFLAVCEAFLRLLSAIVFVNAGYQNLVFLSIPISLTVALILNWLFTRHDDVLEVRQEERTFNFSFFATSALNGISNIAFLTLDVVLVKHFLNPVEAGQYGLLSLVGKMTYFLGSLLGPFMIPIVSKNEGAKKDSTKTFQFLFIVTALLSVGSFVILGVFGKISVPLLFGEKTLPVVELLAPYVLAMAVFTVTGPIVNYFQAKENYIFAVVGFLVSVLQIILISIFHSSLEEVVWVMLLISTVNLTILGILFVINSNLWIAYSNLKDLSDLIFAPLQKSVVRPIGRKSILIFNWRDIRHKWAGGAETYIHELGKRWVKEGAAVTIFCGSDGKSPRYQVIDGIQIIRRGGFYMVYIWAILYYLLRFRGKFDFVIDSENGIPFFTPLYVKKPKYLLIHHVHQEVFREHLFWPLAVFASILEGKLMPLVYKNQKVITVSESSKAEILKLSKSYLKSVDIINPGIHHELFERRKKSKFPTFLYLGRLQPYKNVDVALKAFKHIADSYPKARFNIAGEGVSKTQLIKLADKLGILKNVSFLGRVSEKQKKMLMAQSWAMVQPSMIEGWGITVIEANAAGTPVIASNVNGLKDSIVDKKTGLLVRPKSIDGFADAMQKIISDEKLRVRLSNRAYEWSKNFSWDKSAGEFLNSLIQEPEDGGKPFSYRGVALSKNPPF